MVHNQSLKKKENLIYVGTHLFNAVFKDFKFTTITVCIHYSYCCLFDSILDLDFIRLFCKWKRIYLHNQIMYSLGYILFGIK